jgi:hypothetical protein
VGTASFKIRPPPLMVLKKQIKTTKIKNTKTHVYIFLKNFVNRKGKPWE